MGYGRKKNHKYQSQPWFWGGRTVTATRTVHHFTDPLLDFTDNVVVCLKEVLKLFEFICLPSQVRDKAILLLQSLKLRGVKWELDNNDTNRMY